MKKIIIKISSIVGIVGALVGFSVGASGATVTPSQRAVVADVHESTPLYLDYAKFRATQHQEMQFAGHYSHSSHVSHSSHSSHYSHMSHRSGY